MNHLLVIVLAAYAAWGEPPRGEDPLAPLEAQIIAADGIALRRVLIEQYLAAAAKAGDAAPALSDREKKLVRSWSSRSKAAGTALTPVVGRFNIALVPAATAENIRQRAAVATLDAAYVLLKRLFGIDPVERRKLRIIHRYEAKAKTDDLVAGQPGELTATYGPRCWKIRGSDADEDWREPFLREMARCFLAHSPDRAAIEALPGSSGAWPEWGRHMVLEQLPGEARFAARRSEGWREAVKSLAADLKWNGGEFTEITEGPPACGLLHELLSAAKSDSADPYGPVSRALAALNSRPDEALRGHWPLELLRFATALEDHAGGEVLAALRRSGLGVTRADTDAYRRWRDEFVPTLERLDARTPATRPATGTRPIAAHEGARLTALLDELGKSGPLRRDLREQGLATLCRTLTALDEPAAANAARDARTWNPRWAFLGPFDTAKNEDGLARTFVNESATDREKVRAPHTPECSWSADPHEGRHDEHNLGRLYAGKPGTVAYAFAEIDAEAPQRMTAYVSAVQRARVWVNGRPVGGAASATLNSGSRVALPVELKRGKNAILVKIASDAETWQFHFRLAPALPKPP